MSLSALSLLLLAALLHMGWNFLVKRAANRQIFTWLSVVAGAVCFAPFVLGSVNLPPQIWPFILASAFVEFIYYLALTYAYGKSDFSLVYPIARGGAPALIALWAILFLGETLTPGGVAGLALLILGLMIVGSAAFFARNGEVKPKKAGILAAMGVACCISIYSAIDGAAVKSVEPLPYITVVMLMTAVLLTPPMLGRYGWPATKQEIKTNWPRILAVGIGTMIAYSLVLFAYQLSSVSYAGAIREISVVFGAIAGWLWLKESFGLPRTIGSILIFLGIVIIAVTS